MQGRLLLSAILVIAAGLLIVPRSRGQDPLDSLIACHQTQKLIFENAFVRVIGDVIPPGVAEPKHRHPHGVVIALEDGDTETHSYPDGKAVRRHTSKVQPLGMMLLSTLYPNRSQATVNLQRNRFSGAIGIRQEQSRSFRTIRSPRLSGTVIATS